jgi:hypothetical protein
MPLGNNSMKKPRHLLFSRHELALNHQRNDNLSCTEKIKQQEEEMF